MFRPSTSLILLVSLSLGCPAPPKDSTGDTTTPDTGERLPMEPLFSFAVLADPHLTGGADNDARALAAVEWINAHAAERSIELVLIVGDIAWNAGTETAPALFSALEVPWVPVTGDNEIQSEDEQAFFEAFEPQWQALGSQLEGFTYAAMPVDNPAYETSSWFTNQRFTHRGVTFMGLDWCTRTIGGIFGEMADLNDLEGGTWSWFDLGLQGLDAPVGDSVVMFSHHPMHLSPGAFDLVEMAALEGLTEPWWDQIYASFAGHYHMDGYEELESGAWEVFVTDATWDDEVRVRVVEVSGNGRRFAYEHELISVE